MRFMRYKYLFALLIGIICFPSNHILGYEIYGVEYDFIGEYNDFLRSGMRYFKINDDSSTVSLVRATQVGQYSVTGQSINFSETVVNPNDGKEYITTSIGDGQSYLYLKNSIITSNVRVIRDFALAISWGWKNTINDDCEFDYLGYKANPISKVNVCRIADNGVYYLDNVFPQTLYIGRNVKLYSDQCAIIHEDSDLSNFKIYSYSTVPPIIEAYEGPVASGAIRNSEPKASFFKDVIDSLYRADHTTVYVPYGCREAYVADPEWGKFENIREMAYDPASGIDDVVADEVLGISVATEPSALRVTAPGRHTVSVYAISGMLVKRAETADDGQATIAIEAGAYIVKVGERFIRKVVVR